ncbi:uncharacterized protein PGRI_024730 [Penicillium griseofulvum]|uniref:non-specific serine/threonine protein kinase n=1 Tax=Penicillium patulum TaxID=5078 RepID=A0A135LI09_PENPA|nr:uncharacterized protein PGRI_024730 [Penicillium griseofulvum]KXG48603.1 hypothetical protein PGRI_024730 [Penicillium griseofulvum]
MTMTSLLKWARTAMKRGSSPVLRFPTSGFEIIKQSQILEEERFEEFKKGHYYPANIGEVLGSKYQVLGKLGFGTTSTVWLARDLEGCQYVTLKVYTMDGTAQREVQIYKALSQGNTLHPGYSHVRTALDAFTIWHQGNEHHCVVQKPMWGSFRHFIYRSPGQQLSEDLFKSGLKQIFLALDYLHSECQLVHTEHPSAGKSVNNMPVYASRRFELPQDFGRAVLSDFGSAVRGDQKRNHDAQPTIYRSPEVMLKTEWSYPIDIWNVGTMIWDLFEGKHMFIGLDPDGKGYSTRAHLAELIGVLGPPPLDLLKRGERSLEFFTKDGHWRRQVDIPWGISLRNSENRLSGRNKELFLKFIRGMLQWQPEDRKTAKQLLKDPWLENRT